VSGGTAINDSGAWVEMKSREKKRDHRVPCCLNTQDDALYFLSVEVRGKNSKKGPSTEIDAFRLKREAAEKKGFRELIMTEVTGLRDRVIGGRSLRKKTLAEENRKEGEEATSPETRTKSQDS